MTNTLDEGYAAAAARRGRAPGAAPGGARPGAGRLDWRSGAVLAAIGLTLTLAAVQAHHDAPAAARTRQALVTEVERRSAVTDSLAGSERGLQAEIDRLRASALRAGQGEAATRRLARLRLAAGAVPLAGPGLVVTLDDAQTPTPGPLGDGKATPDAEAGRVLDRDLQQVVNALWAAGAEAIAVNGERLSSLSSIREAGDAILVDFRPLSPPYRIVALGDPGRLPADFTAGSTAGRFRTYAEAYGLRFGTRTVDRAQVPAATGLLLHTAAAGQDGAGSPAPASPTAASPTAVPTTPPVPPPTTSPATPTTGAPALP